MMRKFQAVDGALALLFVLPFLLSVAGGAAVVKTLFPLAATLLGAWLARTDPARWMRLLLWTLLVAPCLRHFVDWYAGYSQSNPVSLTGYLIVLSATPTVALHLLTGRRYAVEFLVIIAVVVLSLGIALNTGTFNDPLIMSLRWLAPPWVAIYICARAESLPAVRASALQVLRWGIPLVSVYGLYQFVDITPWDAYYMRNAPINSIGFPYPFLVRVFSSMNSPGTLAGLLCTGMLLQLPATRGVLRWAGVLLAMGVLLLTTQRAALGGFTVAVLVMVLAGRDGAVRRGIAKMVVTVAIVFSLVLLVPEASRKVMGTLNSISQLDQDDSAKERWQQYRDVLPMLNGYKLGRGMSWMSNPIYFPSSDAYPVDSGLIDVFISLGIPGGVLFLLMEAALGWQGWRICRSVLDAGAVAEFSAFLYGFIQLPFGSQHIAELGIFAYLALGLLLARGIRLPVASRLAARDATPRLAQGRSTFVP